MSGNECGAYGVHTVKIGSATSTRPPDGTVCDAARCASTTPSDDRVGMGSPKRLLWEG